VSTTGPNELNGRPLPSVTSSARTTGVIVGSILRAATDRARQLACSAAAPRRRSPSSSARTSGQRPGTSIGSVMLRRYSPVPATSTASVRPIGDTCSAVGRRREVADGELSAGSTRSRQ
jgi:hypothetical protein